MGVFLIVSMLAGGAAGVALSVIPAGLGVFVMVRLARHRRHAWWWFAGVFLAALVLLCLAVGFYPYPPVSPGSDYDIAAKNLFLQGLGYGLAPGLAVLLAAAACLLPAGRAVRPAD